MVRDYAKIRYKTLIRITLKDKNYIRSILDKKETLAGKLENIIKFYQKYGRSKTTNSKPSTKEETT